MREMKDSGLAWGVQIPDYWDISRLGYESYVRARLGWRGLKADEYVDEGYAFISAFNIQAGRLVWEPLNFITAERYEESPEIKLHVGDVLIVKDGAGVGKVARIDSMPEGEAAPNSSIGVITPHRNLDYRYLAYFLQSPVFNYFVLKLLNGMGVPHLTQEVLRKIQIFIPPLSEQHAISTHLDAKCSEIDALTAGIQSEIDTLQQYKRSVITEAVTKGLDKNAEMKESGIEWIGEIPVDWKMTRLKYVSEFYNGDRGSNYPRGDDLVDEGIPFLTSNNIHGESLDVSDEITKYITTEKYNSLGGAKIKKNDIIFCLRGSVGTCAINKSIDEGTVASSLVDIRPVNIDPNYLNYVLNSPLAEIQTLDFMNGSCALNLSAENVGSYLIVVPPENDQHRISAYLDSKCSEIDEIITLKKQQLDALEKYKKSLIYEYVTGKKEVPAK